ncbi:MAG TPA: 5-formyltetrahydrofolate cyclo-ligase [Clostridiales bacterium UBA8960]|jgi:5-formyltetrahydrofolate cyclo-ligase|nr:5-formyltetrahydrofolate cyclo-ligase [Clostridiales bacterium UBA8960]
MTKKALRSDIIKKRQSIDERVRVNAPAIILDKLLSMPEFTHANVISSFVSFRDELEMNAINTFIIAKHKTLLLPYIDSNPKKMVFYKVEDLSQLVKNDFGIFEPDPSIHKRFDPQEIECVLTPGVAFDMRGFRLGYGGGFYDKFFSEIKKTTPKIGVAYEMQFVETLPVEEYDQPITHLVTETGIRVFMSS